MESSALGKSMMQPELLLGRWIGAALHVPGC